MSGETPSKSSGDVSRDMKKLKSFDGLANVEAAENGVKPRGLERYLKLKHVSSAKILLLRF